MAVNTTVQVTMPAMGESVTEGTVLEWHKQEGDTVEADEILVEISTDKVDAEVPAPAGGTVVKLLVAEGDTVEVGQAIARMAVGAGAAKPSPAEEAPSGNGAAAASAAPVAPATNGDTNATPVAQRVAAAEGVDLSSVAGSGPRGRITKADVLNGG